MKKSKASETFSNFIIAVGVILAVSYPVLAISTCFRAVYQIFENDPTNTPLLTLIAAGCYILATIGFARQPRADVEPPKREPRTFFGRWYRDLTPQTAWRISVYVLVFETILTIVVGTLSYVRPDLLGRNVWSYFGRDYGYFPLIQPLLGIAWLFNRVTLQNYQIGTYTSS